MQPMLANTMESRFGNEVQRIMEVASRLYQVEVNDRWMCSELNQETVEIAKTYEITWEVLMEAQEKVGSVVAEIGKLEVELGELFDGKKKNKQALHTCYRNS